MGLKRLDQTDPHCYRSHASGENFSSLKMFSRFSYLAPFFITHWFDTMKSDLNNDYKNITF